MNKLHELRREELERIFNAAPFVANLGIRLVSLGSGAHSAPAADPRQCSCAEHSERRGLQGLRDFGAGKLPFIEVRQNSGSEQCGKNSALVS
ncbi:protein of unknown function [uncultured Woeseiaceae bacterium]|uniref:Uncharacterized protein n=1 Tax=uncultured Woeseiaceae bacterium TaxID=1983305 RepID=A0A7D9D3Y5_9GAMM|nr:protein of unknown function [uncultured Woeseiaceae bacterium]